MDRINELLGRITELSDAELNELRDLIVAEMGGGAEGDVAEDVELSVLESLATAADTLRAEVTRRDADKNKRAELSAKMKQFSTDNKPAAAPAAPAAPEPKAEEPKAEEPKTEEPVVAAGAQAEVPEDRKPRVTETTSVVVAAADIPGVHMGSSFGSAIDVAKAFADRSDSMRGSVGANGEKIRIARVNMSFPEDRSLRPNDAEGNLAKVMAVTSPSAIVAAGGLGAFRETRYDLFNVVGTTDRPVRDALPVFRTDRGGVRFMRPPTLNDVNGVTGIWTVQNDIDARTNPAIRKPSFRVLPGPEVSVDTQAITMIMTFGNLMTRAYPELIKRHNELGLVAHARVSEQQLLTQIGALSTAVTSRAQKLGAAREFLLVIEQAAAAIKNRHRLGSAQQMRVILPDWFRGLLRADIAASGESLDLLDNADARINGWFSSRSISVTWALDGEAGQDYASMTVTGTDPDGAGPGVAPVSIADFPDEIVWYMFPEGTFSFMDGGTLDLGLVRDSTLNAANDYQMFVETFENIVKFGHESYRVKSAFQPTGAWAAGTAYTG